MVFCMSIYAKRPLFPEATIIIVNDIVSPAIVLNLKKKKTFSKRFSNHKKININKIIFYDFPFVKR